MSLINCETSWTLTWSKNCVLTDLITYVAVAARRSNPARPAIAAPANATFNVTDTKLYFPVVTLSAQDDNKLLEKFKPGFRRTIKWNKYRSEMTNHSETDNLNYLVDPTFSKANRLYALSLENEEVRTFFKVLYTYC